MEPRSLRILGVDPGTRHCGYGVVERVDGKLRYVECGVIKPASGASIELRLAEIASEMGAVIRELAPEVVAVEDVFSRINSRTALILGHARGVVLAAAGAARLAVHAYPPATVKRAVTGHGAAGKTQVSAVVRALLGMRRDPRSDAADALAVAICHAHHRPPLRATARSGS